MYNERSAAVTLTLSLTSVCYGSTTKHQWVSTLQSVNIQDIVCPAALIAGGVQRTMTLLTTILRREQMDIPSSGPLHWK